MRHQSFSIDEVGKTIEKAHRICFSSSLIVLATARPHDDSKEARAGVDRREKGEGKGTHAIRDRRELLPTCSFSSSSSCTPNHYAFHSSLSHGVRLSLSNCDIFISSLKFEIYTDTPCR